MSNDPGLTNSRPTEVTICDAENDSDQEPDVSTDPGLSHGQPAHHTRQGTVSESDLQTLRRQIEQDEQQLRERRKALAAAETKHQTTTLDQLLPKASVVYKVVAKCTRLKSDGLHFDLFVWDGVYHTFAATEEQALALARRYRRYFEVVDIHLTLEVASLKDADQIEQCVLHGVHYRRGQPVSWLTLEQALSQANNTTDPAWHLRNITTCDAGLGIGNTVFTTNTATAASH